MTTILHSDGKKYSLFTFKKEDPLEDDVLSHADEVFGERTLVLPEKFELKGKEKGTKPDGYLIDLSNPSAPIFYILEIERFEHDILTHIGEQILRFELNFTENQQKIYERLCKSISEDQKLQLRCNDMLKGTPYKNVEALLHEMIFNKRHTVLVVIDKIKPTLAALKELFNFPIRIIEFKTYVRDIRKGWDKDHIHRFDPLYPEDIITEIEEIKAVDTTYRINFQVLEEPNSPRKEFENKHGLTPRIQGFVYLYDESKNITGIVFSGYESQVTEFLDKHSKGVPYPLYWQTKRPVDPSYWPKDMEVYILDTYWDPETGKFSEIAKIRVRGRIDSLEIVKAGKPTQLYPLKQFSQVEVG